MTEFKVGDKATHEGFGDVEITYGPYTNAFGSTRFLARRENGCEVAVDPGSMTITPKFAVGDKVTTGRAEFTVEAGPFQGYGEWYAVRQGDGKVVSSAGLGAFTKVEPAREIKVGDRVRILTTGARGASVVAGEIYTVRYVDPGEVQVDGSGHADRWYLDPGDVELLTEPPADTETVDGVVYDLSARYRDRDGDVWHFKRFGDDVRGGIGRTPTSAGDGDSLRFAHGYGPLIKI
ncbi:phiSA1p31-related protein [Streptomyces sp. NPDC056508]|uniref:phiSA1p31-related protein n=1 Tax=Streptomyces sp. NPDC056508 TaxID=3345845 RepID=UPI0036CB9D83